MPQRVRAWVFLVMLVVAGCGRPPEPKYSNVYRGLSEALPRLDTGVLAGRRILIDPGHGGYYRGTLGQNGLEEAQVNLGVSLYLWGLLREVGAEAFLTRSAERDFLTAADTTLADELAVRVAMVDSLHPDILVSIHHNAQPERDPHTNAVETYYRFGDPASMDLAFAVHRHLMRNLGIDDGEVRPGNYYILRNIEIPAILGEGSYLTQPNVEENLRLSEKQRLEAEAYFLGILEYFSRGTPTVSVASPTDSILTDIPTLRFDVADSGGIGIDPAGIDIVINSTSVDAYLDASGTSVVYPLPWDAPNGHYDVTFGVRNVLGNSSSSRRLGFELALPPQAAIFDAEPQTSPGSGGTIRVRARLLDRRGLSIADDTPVTIETSSGVAPESAVVQRGFVEFPLTVARGASPPKLAVTTGDKRFEFQMTRGGQTEVAFDKLVIADAVTRAPIHSATIFHGDSLSIDGSLTGTYFVPPGSSGRHDYVIAGGYEPFRPDENALPDTVLLTPWYEGRLLGRRFVVDPEGGFGANAGIGKLGLPGPFVNLQVATYLGEFLEAAGAQVELTRRSEDTLSPRDVVSLTNRVRADRYVEIRHRGAHPDSTLRVDAYFFPGSQTGRAMATDVQQSLSGFLGLDFRRPRSMVTFPLQQTACPAIVVEFPSITSIEEETRLGEPWYQRRQAYGLFIGILRHFGVVDTTQVTLVVPPGAEAWLVRIDATWNLLTDPGGCATFVGLSRDRDHWIELRRQGVRLARTLPTLAGYVPATDTLRVTTAGEDPQNSSP